jgi:hypothetical protein
MPKMQIRCRGIDTQLDAQRTVLIEFALHIGCRDKIGDPASDHPQLLVSVAHETSKKGHPGDGAHEAVDDGLIGRGVCVAV